MILSSSDLLGNDEVGHGPVLDDFISWCAEAFLQIKASKTKEVCIDFRRPSPVPLCSVVNNQPVELVTNYKYLGTIIGNKVKFDANCEMLCKERPATSLLSEEARQIQGRQEPDENVL